jgi:hypothetical protein
MAPGWSWAAAGESPRSAADTNPGYSDGVSEKDAVLRMIRGFRAAGVRQRALLRAEGPRPAQAIAEAIAAAAALAAQGKWPGPRDPVSERAVDKVRQRWARIGHHAKKARQV